MTDTHDDVPDPAEQLDEDVLGDVNGVDDLPGLNRFVDIGPMSAEDPSVLAGSTEAVDSEVIRDWRREPEVDVDDTVVADSPGISLLGNDDRELDDEEELLGEAVRPADGQIGPEDAAIHIEPDTNT